MARSHESLWLWTGGGFTAVGAALISIAGGLDAASKVPYSFWTSAAMIAAYVMFGLTIACLACAVREVRFPFAAADQSPQPLTAVTHPSSATATARTRHPHQDAAINLETLRDLIVEGETMQARVAGQRSLIAAIPPGLSKNVTEWEARVGTVLEPRPELLTHFRAASAPVSLISTLAGPAGKLHDDLGQRIKVLKAILQSLAS